MRRTGLILTILVTGAVAAFLVAMIWVSLSRVPNGGTASQSAPVAAVQNAPPPTATATLSASGLLIPVAGIRSAQLVDTYDAARAGGQRRHDAIDIMAPRGTLVLAAAPGRVEKLYFSNGGGGITAYVRSPDGRWIYYYAHLDHYAPGLAEGQQLQRGAPIGYVGSTGDASPDGPHLHFAINAMAQGERWWQGTPINPYPLLAGDRH